MSGKKHRLRFTSNATVFVLLHAAVLLTNCSALVNPDPDSLDRRDGGDVDGQEDTAVDVVDGEVDVDEEHVDMAEDAQAEEDAEDISTEDAAVEDILEEPDGSISGGTILFFDSGGGKASNDQYLIYGSISGRSCKLSGNDIYTLQSCEMNLINP